MSHVFHIRYKNKDGENVPLDAIGFVTIKPLTQSKSSEDFVRNSINSSAWIVCWSNNKVVAVWEKTGRVCEVICGAAAPVAGWRRHYVVAMQPSMTAY